LVIMLDGAGDLCATPNRRANAEAAEALRRLLVGGGAHGIHLVVAAERPDEIMGSGISWGARIAGRVVSAEAARLATGVKGSGAQGLLGAGDFLVTLKAELIRFQAAAVSQSDLARAVDLILACANPRHQPDEEEIFLSNLDRALPPPRPISRSWDTASR
jgi:DNA segregation ATPase FtsK/SpoIIIE-like protein